MCAEVSTEATFGANSIKIAAAFFDRRGNMAKVGRLNLNELMKGGSTINMCMMHAAHGLNVLMDLPITRSNIKYWQAKKSPSQKPIPHNLRSLHGFCVIVNCPSTGHDTEKE